MPSQWTRVVTAQSVPQLQLEQHHLVSPCSASLQPRRPMRLTCALLGQKLLTNYHKLGGLWPRCMRRHIHILSIVTGLSPFSVNCFLLNPKPTKLVHVFPSGSPSPLLRVWLATSLVEAAFVVFWRVGMSRFQYSFYLPDTFFQRSSVAWLGHTAMRLM